MGQGTAIGDALTFAAMKAQRKANGMAMKRGTIIDARILAAPSSTKNKRKKRYPVMHQDCKEKQWHFAMKVHLEVDSKTGLIRSGKLWKAGSRPDSWSQRERRECRHSLASVAELAHRVGDGRGCSAASQARGIPPSSAAARVKSTSSPSSRSTTVEITA